jgi:hypothetical protein
MDQPKKDPSTSGGIMGINQQQREYLGMTEELSWEYYRKY